MNKPAASPDEIKPKELDVRIQNSGRDTDAACDADHHRHCACPKTCKCECHAVLSSPGSGRKVEKYRGIQI